MKNKILVIPQASVTADDKANFIIGFFPRESIAASKKQAKEFVKFLYEEVDVVFFDSLIKELKKLCPLSM